MDFKKIAAAVAAAAVAGGLAAATIGFHPRSGNSSAEAADLATFRNCILPEFVASGKTGYKEWSQQNPSELSKWETFRDDILDGGNPTPPVLVTHYGKALVCVGQVSMNETSPPPPTTTTTTTTTTSTTTTPPPPPPDTTPPNKPILIGPSAITQTSAVFSWQAGVDNVGVDHYNVFRGTSAAVADQSKVVETNSLLYTYTGLTCNTDYSFAIEVQDAAGNKSVLEQAIWFPVHTLACDGPPPPPPPPPPTGISWYVSTSGNDANNGSQTSPFKTYNKALQTASCGQNILVMVGSYPEQKGLLKKSISCAGNPITLQADVIGDVYAPRIWFGNCDGCYSQNGASDVILRGFHTDGIILWSNSVNVTLDKINGGSFFIKSPQNIKVLNSDWGPCSSNAAPTHTAGIDTCLGYYGIQQSRIATGDSGHQETKNILIQGNVFHDHPAYDPDHWECTWINGGTDVTYRGNRIYNCQNSASIFFNGTFDNGCRGTWLFENNWFGKESNGSAIGMGSIALPNCQFIVRFNSFAAGEAVLNQGIPQTAPAGHLWFVGNIFGRSTCIAGVTYLYNVYPSGASCGTGSVSVSTLPYVNGSNGVTGDYHLSANSAADNLVPASAQNSGATVDYDGQTRPIGSAKDAGSDER